MKKRSCNCVYYEDDNSGEKPVKLWLDELEKSNRAAFELVHRKVRLLEERGVEEAIRSKLLKHVREKIFEIKAKRAQPRVLGWHERVGENEERFWAAAAEMKDQNALSEQCVASALARYKAWKLNRGTAND